MVNSNVRERRRHRPCWSTRRPKERALQQYIQLRGRREKKQTVQAAVGCRLNNRFLPVLAPCPPYCAAGLVDQLRRLLLLSTRRPKNGKSKEPQKRMVRKAIVSWKSRGPIPTLGLDHRDPPLGIISKRMSSIFIFQKGNKYFTASPILFLFFLSDLFQWLPEIHRKLYDSCNVEPTIFQRVIIIGLGSNFEENATSIATSIACFISNLTF